MNRNISFATLLVLGALPLVALSAEAAPPSAKSPLPENTPAAPMASPGKDQPAPMFDALDTNHDGYVTKDEAKRSADITARFKGLDSDHDGRISASEFTHGKMESDK